MRSPHSRIGPAGKNALIKHLKTASMDEQSRTQLSKLAEAVHQAHKGLKHPSDVWLQPSVMAALNAWRSTLSLSSWALVGEISRQLVGATRVGQSGLDCLHLHTRGYVS